MGQGNPGHKINVSASWNSSGQAVAGKDGKWSVALATPEAGGPYTITVSGNDTTIIVKMFLSGRFGSARVSRIWKCLLPGGRRRTQLCHSAGTIASASIPDIRIFNVQKKYPECLLMNVMEPGR